MSSIRLALAAASFLGLLPATSVAAGLDVPCPVREESLAVSADGSRIDDPLATFSFGEPRTPNHLIIGLPWKQEPGAEVSSAAKFVEDVNRVLREARTGLQLTTVDHFRGLSAILVSAPDESLPAISRWLASCPHLVRYVELDYRVDVPEGSALVEARATPERFPLDPSDPFFDPAPFEKMGITDAWGENHLGSDAVIVGVIDSGIALDHVDLAANLWRNPCGQPGYNGPCPGADGSIHGWNFLDGTKSPGAGANPHGTQVAGLIGAIHGNGFCSKGVSPNVRLVSLKISEGNRSTIPAAVRALEHAVAIPAAIVNASWSVRPVRVVYDAVASARKANVVVVAAAPTLDRDVDQKTPAYPCGIPLDNVICVTAVDQHDELVNGASFGRVSVDLAAIATSIRTTYPARECRDARASSSMAAPYVTGVAALLRGKCEKMEAKVVRRRILESVGCNGCLKTRTVSGGRLLAIGALEPDCE